MARDKSSTRGAEGGTFVKSYRHHKTGKPMKASDYGLKAFYFPPKKTKKAPPPPQDDPSIPVGVAAEPDSLSKKKSS